MTEDQEKKPNPEEDKLQTENDGLRRQLSELTDTLQRLQAEFENYRKRIQKDSQAMIELANEDLIRDILPILDNFELALSTSKAKDDFSRGMEMIFAQFITMLENEGVKPIDARGKLFDPKLHEALLVEQSEQPNNTVIEELQKGYIMGDKVIRHTKVKLSKQVKKERKEEQKKEQDNNHAGADTDNNGKPEEHKIHHEHRKSNN